MTLACSVGIMCMFLDYKSLNADSFSEALLLIFFLSKLCIMIMFYGLYTFMSVLTTLMLNFKGTGWQKYETESLCFLDNFLASRTKRLFYTFA